jgi:hypothetical protein
MKIKTPYTEQDLITENNMMDSDYMNTEDLEVTLSCKEHEILNDVLMSAVDSLYALLPSGWRELPEDNELYVRYTQIDELQEKFSDLWLQRFHK